MELMRQPGESGRLGDWLQANLAADWIHFRAAVAFVKRSGVKHIAAQLAAFAEAGEVEIIVGIDHQGTSYEGLDGLLRAASPNGRVVVFHNRLRYTFHPKLYLFKSATHAEVVVGSGNLTEGGLFTNYEAALRLGFDLAKPEDAAALQSVESALDEWSNLGSGTAFALDDGLLSRLRNLRLVPMEVLTASQSGESSAGSGAAASPFASRQEHPAPLSSRSTSRPEGGAPSGEMQEGTSGPRRQPLSASCFVMTLQKTDVGVGQTSEGTSKRSPEIFIPLSARDAQPSFWDWPHGFSEDSARSGKWDRQARVRLGAAAITVNMMTWPDRHDFRLRSESLRSAAKVGDILRIEKVKPELGFDYYVEIIPEGTAPHTEHLLFCTGIVRNSRKRFGYF